MPLRSKAGLCLARVLECPRKQRWGWAFSVFVTKSVGKHLSECHLDVNSLDHTVIGEVNVPPPSFRLLFQRDDFQRNRLFEFCSWKSRMGSLPLSPLFYLDSFPGNVLRLPGKATPENPLLKGSVQCPLRGTRARVCPCVRVSVCVSAFVPVGMAHTPIRNVSLQSSDSSEPLIC